MSTLPCPPAKPQRIADFSDLIPLQQLERSEDDGWTALGSDPQLLLEQRFPAGWLRLRYQLWSEHPGCFEVYADTGSGFSVEGRIERMSFGRSLRRDCFIWLSRPALALRIDPVDRPGAFHLSGFSARPVPTLLALGHAVVGKLRVLSRYQCLKAAFWRGARLLARGQFRTFACKLFKGLDGLTPDEAADYREDEAYAAWRARNALTEARRATLRAEALALSDPPRISVLMPVYNPPLAYLRLAIESVLRQTYPHWELCIADDASTAEGVRPLLKEYARRDARIRVTLRPERGNISAASNSALGLATGDYVALLDQDDELAEHALSSVARTIVTDRSVDMVYTDEDKLGPDGRHVEPFFKPDWSPEYLLACMYTCHLGVYRTSLVHELGGFRSECDLAQDYDLVLRLSARTDRIVHIPDVLYHWRKLPTSTASGMHAKPGTHAAARRALGSHLKQTGREAQLVPGPGFARVRFAVTAAPLVSIVIPTAGKPAPLAHRRAALVEVCVESIRRLSTYRNYEIIVVHNDDLGPALTESLPRLGVHLVAYREPFNLSRKINRGAAEARGDHLLLLNDDTEVITPDWLESMLEYSQQEPVGAVGAKLLFPSGRLQHAGVVILDGQPGHPYHGTAGESPGYFWSNQIVRNYSAVTGACLMTRAAVFHEAGGFDEAFPLNYNDVDFCLRVLQTGRRIVYTPYAQLYHYEAISKDGVYERELDAFRRRWADVFPRDRHYNPNLTRQFPAFRVDPEGSPER